MVRDNMFQEAVEFPDIVEEESSCFFCCDHYMYQSEVHSFEDRIHDSHDSVMFGGLLEFNHKVYTECIPPFVQN